MKKIIQWLLCGSGSSARACLFGLRAEVCGTELWSGMAGLAWANCTKADHFRVYHVYAL